MTENCPKCGKPHRKPAPAVETALPEEDASPLSAGALRADIDALSQTTAEGITALTTAVTELTNLVKEQQAKEGCC